MEKTYRDQAIEVRMDANESDSFGIKDSGVCCFVISEKLAAEARKIVPDKSKGELLFKADMPLEVSL